MAERVGGDEQTGREEIKKREKGEQERVRSGVSLEGSVVVFKKENFDLFCWFFCSVFGCLDGHKMTPF